MVGVSGAEKCGQRGSGKLAAHVMGRGCAAHMAVRVLGEVAGGGYGVVRQWYRLLIG